MDTVEGGGFVCSFKIIYIGTVTFVYMSAVAQKQVDYMNEVKEFEAEMRKHSHKFPHDILTYHTMLLPLFCSVKYDYGDYLYSTF